MRRGKAAALGVAAATDKLRHLHSGRVDGAAVEDGVGAVTRRQREFPTSSRST